MSSLAAWGDESIRIQASEPMYLVAASILEKKPLSQINKLKELAPPNSKKVHWRDMGVNKQRAALQIVAEIPQSTYVVIAAPIKPNRQERARRKCLEVLLPYLESNNVEVLTLESRGDFLDKKDIDFLFYLRRAGIVSSIDVTHATGTADLCLSVPDQILGAYGELLANTSVAPKWLEAWKRIAERITTMRVTP